MASFSTAAGRPSRSLTVSVSGMRSQPGRLGGDRMIPLSGSSGPPHAMPMPAMSGHATPASSTTRPARSMWRSIIDHGPSVAWLGMTARDRTRPSPVTTPAASFVPPMSSPRTCTDDAEAEPSSTASEASIVVI